ncbi:MAG: carbohydrate kinase, partial [Chloroflexales bacterium]|nr:carbohydrate kinase [Chloroflexales bacterium]
MSVANLVAGIDIGTGGVRVTACDGAGSVWAEAERALGTERRGGLLEQDPAEWRQAAAACLRQVGGQLRGRARIVAVAVAATSGTVCLLDERGAPLRPAIMYADSRAGAEAALIAGRAGDLQARMGYAFHSSWGLPKLLWLARNEPELLARARHLAHAGDAVSGWLCGDYAVTDATQALKTGYDLLEGRWPDLVAELGLPLAKLPRVVPSGQPIGQVTGAAAAETGLPAGATVVAGMTDGCAAQVAAGATRPGQWLSVLGTTLVLKGVSRELLRDPLGRLYCHRHPEGYWLPGAASNVGGEALHPWPAGRLRELDRAAAALTPTGLTIYPLRREGERFPFVRPDARGFVAGAPASDEERYAATLEGVAYVERLAYALIAELAGATEPLLLTAGGGARSRVWLQIRADVLQRPLAV